MNRKRLCPTLGLLLSAAVCLGLSGCSKEPAPGRPETTPAPRPPAGLTDVEKPSEDLFPILTPRPQPPIPEALVGREVPYSENRKPPAPTAAESARGFILFSRPINRAVYSVSVPAAHERVEQLSAFATPGEFEPMPFSVYSLRDIRNLRVRVSELRSRASRIGPDNLDLRLVTEWAMRYPRYTSDTYRRLPELLEAVTRNSFPAKTSQRYWLTVRTPDDAPAGLYTGHVTIYDDLSERATRLPIQFRVLDFRLRRDPAKRYSVYYYEPRHDSPNMPEDLLARALHNDLTAMLEHGIDMFPTLVLMETFNEQGQPEVAIRNPQVIDKMIEMGFQGPIPLIENISHFYRTFVPDGTRGRHWAVDKIPKTDDLYHAVEAAFRKLRLDFEARGWPEPIVCPMDEVAVSSADFAARVYAAIRRAGVRTYITKDPTAPDAEIYRRLDAVDVWCSQPYAIPYAAVVADTRYEYWSYPNHIAGERKNREIMHRGGRMTYGYGLWRSGYTTLIPWHWRWITYRKDHFNYLAHPRLSGCGTRMDEEGNVIPAVYWSSFREGYDDLRYLYTLQQAIHDRRDATDPRARSLVEEALALIQETWNSVPPEKLYLAHNSWTDEQFATTRWRIARLISALHAFPAPDHGQAPSVMADPEAAFESAPDPFETARQQGILDAFSLGKNEFSAWRAVNREVTREILKEGGSVPGHPAMRMDVKVDHLVDGGREDGKYPVGWPRIRRAFEPGEVNLDDYDFLSFQVRIDSTRDEVADDVTPFVVNFASHEGTRLDHRMDLGDVQRDWITFRIALADIREQAAGGPDAMRSLSELQLVISEAYYAHGTFLRFEFDQVEFVRLKEPVLNRVQAANAILTPARWMIVGAGYLGTAAARERGCRIEASLTDSSGKTVSSITVPLDQANEFRLATDGVIPGEYRLSVSIVDRDGQTLSEQGRRVLALQGPF